VDTGVVDRRRRERFDRRARGVQPLVALLGSRAYYERFGFVPATTHGITAPHEWYGDSFQVRLLEAATGDERGDFEYADAFATVP
jgi:predicted N-acetyltransferase YhbS